MTSSFLREMGELADLMKKKRRFENETKLLETILIDRIKECSSNGDRVFKTYIKDIDCNIINIIPKMNMLTKLGNPLYGLKWHVNPRIVIFNIDDMLIIEW